jgi:hypothetical protein
VELALTPRSITVFFLLEVVILYYKTINTLVLSKQVGKGLLVFVFVIIIILFLLLFLGLIIGLLIGP